MQDGVYFEDMRFAKEKTVIGLGVLLIVLPLTGFPREWKTVISVIVGIAIMYVGALFYRVARAHHFGQKKSEIRTETFTESA